MEQIDVLSDVARRLDSLGLPWMLVGSYASGYYGEPRFTKDIDIVVGYQEADAERITAAFTEAYYVDAQMLREAIRHETLANIIHEETLFKIDICPAKKDAYSQQALARRQRIDLGGFSVWIATAEDVILSKLVWNRLSPSELQLQDAAEIIKIYENLDIHYLQQWAQQLGVAEDLEKLLKEAKELWEAEENSETPH